MRWQPVGPVIIGIGMSLLMALAPNPVSFPSFFPEGMLSLPFTAKISRQHREEIPLFFGTCYVILKGEKTTRMGNSSSSFR